MRSLLVALAALSCACAPAPEASIATPAGSLAACDAYAPPAPTDPVVSHLKTSGVVVAVTSPCTVRLRIDGGFGTLAAFGGKEIVLRATYRSDLNAALHSGDAVTLSFDGRAYPDGTYPLTGLALVRH